MKIRSKILLFIAVFIACLGSFYAGTTFDANTMAIKSDDTEKSEVAIHYNDLKDLFASGMFTHNKRYTFSISADEFPQTKNLDTFILVGRIEFGDGVKYPYIIQALWIDDELYAIEYDKKGKIFIKGKINVKTELGT